ncbi:uncharacterized protein TrAFT101_002921 [Trichoderma asperellum]|uniref:uncharacterized protein n=1 Tax=Trichoderma asperellum TaxID=101201 RepID=UPI0033242827|nr:hypothetical protein TrAFT101_002921 [Trichoderma asperellum]
MSLPILRHNSKAKCQSLDQISLVNITASSTYSPIRCLKKSLTSTQCERLDSPVARHSSQPPLPWKGRNIATIYIPSYTPPPSHHIAVSYRKASPSTQNELI